MRWTWSVPPEPLAGRADKRIHEALERGGEIACSRSRVQQLMDEGRVTLNGAPITGSAKLAPGALITIEFPAEAPSELTPEPMDLEILHEDADLVVVNKPQGLTVHPSPTQATGTLVHGLLYRYRNAAPGSATLAPAGGSQRPGIVHRIDKDTSGAIVIARTDLAYHGLVAQFAKHSIDRAYWALCYGAPAETAGKIKGTIARSPIDRKKMAIDVKGGKHALTHYRVLRKFGQSGARPFTSWLELKLETGRTHQIRVHLTSLGHSILGDTTYGEPGERATKWLAVPEDIREKVDGLPGQALHARILGFIHPATRKPLSFEAEPPTLFRELLAALERYS